MRLGNTIRPNESWVSDITYTWTNEGWLYLAGVKKLYTKELVGLPSTSAWPLIWSAVHWTWQLRIKSQAKGWLYILIEAVSTVATRITRSSRSICFDKAPIESCWVH